MTSTQESGAAGAHHATAFTVDELASVLGVSARRVRKMRENGELLSLGRGLIDGSHGIKATMGGRWLGPGKAHVSTFTKAAAGWLMGYQSSGVTPEDLNIWFDAAASWKLDEAQATAELLNAVRLLGEIGPAFHIKAPS